MTLEMSHDVGVNFFAVRGKYADIFQRTYERNFFFFSLRNVTFSNRRSRSVKKSEASVRKNRLFFFPRAIDNGIAYFRKMTAFIRKTTRPRVYTERIRETRASDFFFGKKKNRFFHFLHSRGARLIFCWPQPPPFRLHRRLRVRTFEFFFHDRQKLVPLRSGDAGHVQGTAVALREARFVQVSVQRFAVGAVEDYL